MCLSRASHQLAKWMFDLHCVSDEEMDSTLGFAFTHTDAQPLGPVGCISDGTWRFFWGGRNRVVAVHADVNYVLHFQGRVQQLERQLKEMEREKEKGLNALRRERRELFHTTQTVRWLVCMVDCPYYCYCYYCTAIRVVDWFVFETAFELCKKKWTSTCYLLEALESRLNCWTLLLYSSIEVYLSLLCQCFGFTSNSFGSLPIVSPNSFRVTAGKFRGKKARAVLAQYQTADMQSQRHTDEYLAA